MASNVGQTTGTDFAPVEIRALQKPELFVSIPITVKSGQNLQIGETVAFDGDYVETYSNGVSGSAVGIMTENADATNNSLISSMYVKGIFKKSILSGINLDGGAETELMGKTVKDYFIM